MGSAAEVGERALLVEGNSCVLGQVVYELDLILLAVFLHELDSFRAGKFEPFYGNFRLDYLLHFDFDFLEIFLRNGRVEIDVVIKAVVDYGTYREIAGRINIFNRLR